MDKNMNYNMLVLEIEAQKKKLADFLEQYSNNLNNCEIISLSQELDKLIVDYMKALGKTS